MDVIDLVDKAKGGDKDALLKLVMAAKDHYYRLAYVYVHDEEDSLDALQDMIVILYENINQLKKPEAFYTWSKTILVNCCKKTLKRRKRFLFSESVKEKDYHEEYEKSEHKQDMLSMLSKLNDNQQEAIKLRYYLGWDYQRIAEVTDTPLGTVKSRIFTGIAKMRESLGGEY